MTRFEQIAEAFPLHAQRIAEAVHAQYGDFAHLYEPGHCTAGGTLAELFSWARTSEGFDYWHALATSEGFD